MFNILKLTIMTKTVLNRLVALVCVMLMGLAAKAQTAQYLIVTLQDETKTLNDKAIDAVMQKLINNLKTQLNAELR